MFLEKLRWIKEPFLGWKTNRKFLIIESDDWGSLRTNSINQLEELNKISTLVEGDRFVQLDNIASEEDLELLFETLRSVKDKNGNPAVITANTLMANPDFEKIKKADFNTYHLKKIDKTILDRNNGRQILQLWDEGQRNNLFRPQFHGREHIHALRWLMELKNGNKDLLKAFAVGSYSIPFNSAMVNKRRNLLAALDCHNIENEFEFQKKWVHEGLSMFKEKFGYQSKTFIAPSYIWSDNIESTLKDSGIEILQGLSIQYEPIKDGSLYRKRSHYGGQKNIYGQRYSVRNVFYEPSSNPNRDWVSSALKRMAFVFTLRQPVIISTHRINYIGSLNKKNRDRGLAGLGELLKTAVKKWPDIEFISTDKLIDQLK